MANPPSEPSSRKSLAQGIADMYGHPHDAGETRAVMGDNGIAAQCSDCEDQWEQHKAEAIGNANH